MGPPGAAKSHRLYGLGHTAVGASYEGRYFVATDLVDTPYMAAWPATPSARSSNRSFAPTS